MYLYIFQSICIYVNVSFIHSYELFNMCQAQATKRGVGVNRRDTPWSFQFSRRMDCRELPTLDFSPLEVVS